MRLQGGVHTAKRDFEAFRSASRLAANGSRRMHLVAYYIACLPEGIAGRDEQLVRVMHTCELPHTIVNPGPCNRYSENFCILFSRVTVMRQTWPR